VPVELSGREFWGLVHGMVLGAFFLLAFAGGLAELYGLRTRWNTEEGIVGRVRRLTVGYWVMAVAAWATVVTGTWIVYPWYREKLAGDDLSGCARAQIPVPDKCSPRDFLLSNVSGDTENWHEFGMEWKEHIAWIAPMLATSAAIIIAVYRRRLADAPRIRQIAIWTFVLAFATAAVAGILGALITKVAPVK
jgi:hypothetical protein